MKKLTTITLALFLSLSVFSQTSGVGIGVSLGSSADFTAKFWTGEKTAFAVAAGIDYAYYGGVHFSGDFLIHNWSFDIAEDMMKVYFGPGVGVGIHPSYYNNISVSIRAPAGVGWYFHNIPLECFAEVVPTFYVAGPFGFDFSPGGYIGARWYF